MENEILSELTPHCRSSWHFLEISLGRMGRKVKKKGCCKHIDKLTSFKIIRYLLRVYRERSLCLEQISK